MQSETVVVTLDASSEDEHVDTYRGNERGHRGRDGRKRERADIVQAFKRRQGLLIDSGWKGEGPLCLPQDPGKAQIV